MMHRCTRVLGNMEWIASENPLKPSTAAMNTSYRSRFSSLVTIDSQNLAPVNIPFLAINKCLNNFAQHPRQVCYWNRFKKGFPRKIWPAQIVEAASIYDLPI